MLYALYPRRSRSALCAGPPAAESGVGKDLVRAALAGGIASSSSTLVLHPLDTLKTRIQVPSMREVLILTVQFNHSSLSDSQSWADQSYKSLAVRCCPCKRHQQLTCAGHTGSNRRRRREISAIHRATWFIPRHHPCSRRCACHRAVRRLGTAMSRVSIAHTEPAPLSCPAAAGSFVSHGVRCLAYEAAFAAGMAATDGRHELQVASLLIASNHV